MFQTLIPMDVDVPDIQPNFDAPWMEGFKTLASYFLATTMILLLIGLILSACAVIFPNVGSGRIRSWFADNLLGIFIATAITGGASGIFQWLFNFDFGF